eukprot:gnl/Chilomastix_cuspidata/208.p1 GENE.gnl/Chilomastix_cuspidata/208~~gnl/Chilomastix_cuspidata/208.p1  ORF type:complete len:573 (+),score=103.84 gnl/Chilomastix_cuspidata/208:29-1720(+)
MSATVDIETALSGAMHCFQCEQAARPSGCTVRGVCGKRPSTSAIQDLLVHACHVFGGITTRLPDAAIEDGWLRMFAHTAFSTLTNTNFDDGALFNILGQFAESISAAATKLEAAPGPELTFSMPATIEAAVEAAQAYKPAAILQKYGATLGGLRVFAMHGVKGLCAYATHADHLQGFGPIRAPVIAVARILGDIHLDGSLSEGKLLELLLAVGKANYEVTAALDAAHSFEFGQPEITWVPTRPRPGKCLLVSGHDLKDLKSLLAEADKAGVTVYTHGEMLPAHGYPELKRHTSLYGNFGSAWQNQRRELPNFPGPSLFTTNCIQEPSARYKDSVYTTGMTGWPGCTHLTPGDWRPLIEAALAAPGFSEADCAQYPDTKLCVGAHHKTVLSLADKILDLVTKGKISHFWFIGGCEGAKAARSYFSDLAAAIPSDHVILTAGCGCYRVNRVKDFGAIEGIPRLLDVGQCNDVYGVIQIALGLAKALGCGVNDLPLTLAVSWYEQKAVAQLLTLLYLGVTNIKLGPTLPLALSPEAIGVLVDKFGLKLTDRAEVEADVAAACARPE